jgi:hypothetical protein
MNSRGNEIWLGEDVDRGLLFLSSKGIWIWVGRMRDPLSLRCSLMEERERIGCYDLELVNLPLRRRRGVFYSPWGENDRLGRISGFRFYSRLDRKFNRKLPVGIPVEPKIKPEISGSNRAWDRDQTEPAQKHVWAWLS